MTDAVRDAYDRNAELYASLFLNELDEDTRWKERLATLSQHAAQQSGPIADLGCGPGHVTAYLCEQGRNVVGYDLSPGQIGQAQQAFPDLRFEVGDLANIARADGSLGGIVSRHSLIHLLPSTLSDVFAEWVRVLEPDSPIFVSFFGARAAGDHGLAFDHKVVTAYALFPATVGEQLRHVGFTDIDVEAHPIAEGGRPFDHATVLARSPSVA